MLDQLSGGRVDLGVGRGISPFEHRLFGHRPRRLARALRELLPMVVLAGLATGRMASDGRRGLRFPEVELPVGPVQRPYPPLWAAGNSRPRGATGSTSCRACR